MDDFFWPGDPDQKNPGIWSGLTEIDGIIAEAKTFIQPLFGIVTGRSGEMIELCHSEIDCLKK